MDLLLGTEPIGAAEALRIGLVTRVFVEERRRRRRTGG